MDGGLVCQFLEQSVVCVPLSLRTHPPGHRIVVYNPIARTPKELPIPPSNFLTSEFYPNLTMVVDSTYQNFKIFLFHNFDTECLRNLSTPLDSILNDPLMLVYDSDSNEWKNLTSPFRIRSGKRKGSSVVFQGYLYIYLYSSLREEYPPWRYHLVEDSWENLAVRGFEDELPSSELVVSANRLFLVAWSTGGRLDYDDYEGPWAFQVIELRISDMTREVLFEISKADIVEGFDLKKNIHYDPVSSVPRISVIGFGNSLLFMSKSSGISVAFDLVTRSWD